MNEIVYYIDDDADDRELFHMAFQHITGNTHQLITYTSGEDFMSAFQEGLTPGLAFVDINMFGITGFEVLRNIRKKYSADEFRVVIYSTSNNPNSIITSQALGANAYLIKGTSNKVLAQSIQQILESTPTHAFEVVSGPERF